jgi:hypothetical protein
MLSDAVLEKTIEEIGLQVNVRRGKRFNSILKNVLAEAGKLTEDPKLARFSSVKYQGEKPLSLIIKKVSDTEYHLYDDRRQLMRAGTFGQALVCDTFQFTLSDLPFEDEAALTLSPIQSVASTLRKKLTIKPSREDKNLILIKCLDTDRVRSALIVNTLMAMYEKYLVDENKIIIGAQLSYLNQRQDELSAKLDHDIECHAEALKRNLHTQGFMGIKDEMEFIFEPLQSYQTRLNEVELELRQIDQRLAKTNFDSKDSKLKAEPQLIDRYSKALGDQIGSVNNLLAQARRKEKIEAPSSLQELHPAIQEFNASLIADDSSKQKEIEAVLQEFVGLLTHRQSSLSESSNWMQTVQNELSGMSIDSARTQFNHYSTEFDSLHAQLKQVLFMRDHLFDPQFEISTLSNILSDSVTQQIVQKSSDLEAQLHDDMHRSPRDKERIKSTLSINKRFLESHLDQTLQLGKVRIDLIKEKISSLYSVMKTLLTDEQHLLKEKISQLKESMQVLPDLWVHENRLKFRSELTKGMMEGLVGIAETKNLAHHLYQVESRPLDIARPPLGFVKPLILGKSAFVFFLAAALLALFTILQSLIRGFPPSLATLKELGAHTSGELSISPTTDADKETLRRIVSFLMDGSQKGIAAIIGEKQTVFFPALTALLKKHHLSSCVIDCSFGKIISSEETPGLFQVLNGASAQDAVRIMPSYDFLPVGASSPDGVELLKSAEFEKLLQQLHSKYDFIFLLSRTNLSSIESETLLDLSTHAILVAETPLEKIQNFIDPSRQKEKKHVTFVQIL